MICFQQEAQNYNIFFLNLYCERKLMDQKKQEEDLKVFYKTVGSNVAKIRKAKGVSQFELANALGHKSRTIVSLAELSQKKHFNLEHLFKIAQYLEVDFCDLIEPQN